MIAVYDCIKLLSSHPELAKFTELDPGLNSEQLVKEFFKAPNIFLFSSEVFEEAKLPDKAEGHCHHLLDLPFKTVYMENKGDFHYELPGLRNHTLIGIIHHEISPGNYLQVILAGPKTEDIYRVASGEIPAMLFLTKRLRPGDGDWAVAWNFWKKVSSSKEVEWGTQEVYERVRFKTGSSNSITYIRLVNHLRKKGQVDKSPPIGKEVQWAYRWAVRGHWRRIQGTGKNREDLRVVENATWVTSHLRGEGPLKEQTRVIK